MASQYTMRRFVDTHILLVRAFKGEKLNETLRESAYHDMTIVDDLMKAGLVRN
uniref:ArsR family transcriptional regulator n=1 Tax=Heterorhabditis bacteriophora TaxID=37862 RepID=A0A1I7X5Z5_HETBA